MGGYYGDDPIYKSWNLQKQKFKIRAFVGTPFCCSINIKSKLKPICKTKEKINELLNPICKITLFIANTF